MIHYIAPFIVGIIAGGLVIGGWALWRGNGDQTETQTPAKTDTLAGEKPDTLLLGDSSQEESALHDAEQGVSAQTPFTVVSQRAGSTVSVSNITLDNPSWIVIHEEILDGIIGNALGATRKDAGIHALATIELLRPTEATRRYWVTLYTDNGDKIFSLKDDTPLRDASDKPILTSFVAE